jgi:hypothetical protein
MALEIRPCCEHCGRDVHPGSPEVYICSFECTYCHSCAATRLGFTCPNCHGELVRRPIRPPAMLSKYPASTRRIVRADLAEPAPE